MKTKTVLAAIAALKAADDLLMQHSKEKFLDGDVRISTECFSAWTALEAELIQHFPDVKAKAA